MNYRENKLYLDDITYASNLELSWNKLQDKTILISGATGLVGCFFIDVIMKKNEDGLNCKIIVLGRNKQRAVERFSDYLENGYLEFIEHDINEPINLDKNITLDYVIHMASNTHPLQYSKAPIQTITTNVFGTYNMLNEATKHKNARCVIISSNEIYGENRGDVEKFSEDYCGYIDSNTLRAGYPESKRCSEALAQAYITEKGLDCVIARITRTYGPTILSTDTKAMSQFINKAINGEDIVLKSKGDQYFSYAYVLDSVTGLLTVMLEGECSHAYNISDESSDIRLRDLASLIATKVGKKVIFDLPDSIEAAGYSKATKARLDSAKINSLGWKAKYNIEEGIERTLRILKEI